MTHHQITDLSTKTSGLSVLSLLAGTTSCNAGLPDFARPRGKCSDPSSADGSIPTPDQRASAIGCLRWIEDSG